MSENEASDSRQLTEIFAAASCSFSTFASDKPLMLQSAYVKEWLGIHERECVCVCVSSMYLFGLHDQTLDTVESSFFQFLHIRLCGKRQVIEWQQKKRRQRERKSEN